MKILSPASIIEAVDQNVKNFLILNGLVVFSVIIYLLRRGPKQGIRLKLKASEGKQHKGSDLMTEKKTYSPQNTAAQEGNSRSNQGEAKSLNVIFNYNGHSWDAFEVLGLPAGSSLEKVKQAYEEALRDVDPESQTFVRTAYQAIVTHHNS